MLSCLILVFFFLSLLFPFTISFSYVTENCSTTGNYTNWVSFRSNLDQLLSSLPQNTENNDWFYTDTFGEAYGLAMCPNIDATSGGCANCLTLAAKNITQECPFSAAAAMWYDGCFLRYTKRNFTFTYIDKPFRSVYNEDPASDEFKKALGTLIHDLITDVENSPKLLAQKETSYSTSTGATGYIYGLVQCTRDLDPLSCQQRLNTYMEYINNNYCKDSTGCRIFGSNSYLQYETHPFYRSAQPPPPPPPPPPPTPQLSQTKRSNIAVTVGIALASVILLILLLCAWCCIRRKRRTSAGSNEDSMEKPFQQDAEIMPPDFSTLPDPNLMQSDLKISSSDCNRLSDAIGADLMQSDLNRPSSCSRLSDAIGSAELMQFDLKTLQDATNNFSNENKLGEGGFGQVFKGRLQNGHEIAVKRLSSASKQGIPELENEVNTLGGLKHRNVVRVLGCCMEDNEKLLCYEYLPKGSLDMILFENDSLKRAELDWTTRFKIIQGICRGLVYLHIESGAAIIHRDLKPSNILLDEKMNPKISDFGTARLFDDDQTHKITTNIIGTMGYLAPEYFGKDAAFSAKSDVFSFGILVLEIVTGRRCAKNLVNHVWKHWEKEEVFQLIDAALPDMCLAQATKCIHIGLLCVKQEPKERPNIWDVYNSLVNRSPTMLSRPPEDPRD